MSRVHAEITPVEVTRRRPLTERQKQTLFALHDGRCGLCGLSIAFQEVEWDHRIERDLTQSDAPDQFQLAHKVCHRTKTSERAPVLAHVHRMKAKHEGTAKRGRPIPARVGGGWPAKGKRKMQSRGFAK